MIRLRVFFFILLRALVEDYFCSTLRVDNSKSTLVMDYSKSTLVVCENGKNRRVARTPLFVFCFFRTKKISRTAN